MSFDGVAPLAGCWREVEYKPLIMVEPGWDLRMPMDGVVEGDDLDGIVGGDVSVDHVQEPDELLVPVQI